MNKIYLYSIFIVLALVTSCKCEDTVNCPAISEEVMVLLPNQKESIVFTNGSDSTLILSSTGHFTSSATTRDCDQNLFGGCDCDICEAPQHKEFMRFNIPIVKTDSTFVTYRQGSIVRGDTILKDTSFYQVYDVSYAAYNLQISDMYFRNEARITYQILDFTNRFMLTINNGNSTIDLTSLAPEDRILEDYTTPVKSYSNVIMNNIDKRTSVQHSLCFSKVYYDQREGVIAFESKEGDLFYRSE